MEEDLDMMWRESGAGLRGECEKGEMQTLGRLCVKNGM